MKKAKVLSLDRLIELVEDNLPDPRRPGGNIQHKLVDLLVIILLGVMCGWETWIDIEDYANAKYEWLSQVDIAGTIVDQGAVYMLALKKNQPSLYESVDEYFKWARTEPIEKKQLKEFNYEEHEHGRHIHRKVEVCNDVSWIETVREWKQLSSIICVTRKGEREGHQTEETAYYISSKEWEAEAAAKCIQGHWSIENNLHWSPDTAFNEDESQIFRGNAQVNLNVVRKIAQGLLKSETSFKGGSIRRKANRAAMMNDYAEMVLKLGVNH